MIIIDDDGVMHDVIPKADYETRLKADLEAILVEIQLEIEEQAWRLEALSDGMEGKAVDLDDIDMIIQEKVNALRGEGDGTNEKTSD